MRERAQHARAIRTTDRNEAYRGHRDVAYQRNEQEGIEGALAAQHNACSGGEGGQPYICERAS